MYSIVLTDGKIINVNATEVEWCREDRMIKLYYGRRIVARINMDNVVGWIEADYKAESEDNEMTKEQKDKILKVLVDDRNNYARDCNRRIAEENGKITGADYMLQRFLDILGTEVAPKESEDSE